MTDLSTNKSGGSNPWVPLERQGWLLSDNPDGFKELDTELEAESGARERGEWKEGFEGIVRDGVRLGLMALFGVVCPLFQGAVVACQSNTSR